MNTKKRRKTMYVDIAIIIMIIAIIMIKLLNDDIEYIQQNQQQQETTRNVVESVSELEIEQHTTAIVGNSMEQIIRERATAEPTAEPTTEETTEETTEHPTTEETTCFMVAPAIKCEVDIDDFKLMCRIVMNEAGGNSFKCQLAVAETIVNRVNSEYYPNNIYDVVYQPYQYSHANNGDVTDSVKEAVTQALEESTFDNSMVFFRDWYYHGFAEPYMEIDDMCFSLKKE